MKYNHERDSLNAYNKTIYLKHLRWTLSNRIEPFVQFMGSKVMDCTVNGFHGTTYLSSYLIK